MFRNVKDKNRILGSMCIVCLLIACLIYSGVYERWMKKSQDTVTIGVFSDSYWEVQNGYSYQILEDAISIFEEQNPGVKVDYVSGILKEDYTEWLSEQILSGEAPDLFFVLAEDFNDLAEIGVLKNLTPFLKSDKEFDSDDFYSSALKYGQYDNIQYSLPYECAPKLMFVNKSILDKEGLKIHEEDWTWDDFYKICRAVTKDTDGNGVIDQFGAVGYTWREAFESNGVKLFDQQGTKCFLTGDNVEDSLMFLEKLGNLDSEYDVTTHDFDLGNVVFQPMPFSEYRAYKPYPLSIKKYSGFEWECVPMPKGPSGDNISTLDTLLLAMNENTKNADYAWKFMKILTCDVQIQSEIFDYSEGVSVLKNVTESDRTLQSLIESAGNAGGLNQKLLSDAVENAVVAPRFHNYSGATAEVDKAVQTILNGNSNISMEQIVQNREIDKYLEANGD